MLKIQKSILAENNPAGPVSTNKSMLVRAFVQSDVLSEILSRSAGTWAGTWYNSKWYLSCVRYNSKDMPDASIVPGWWSACHRRI